MLYILYHKIPWWPVQREREGAAGGGRRKLVQLYIGKQGRNRGGGTVPWIVHREEHVVGRSIPLRLEEEEETGGRAEERVNRGAVSLWSVGLLLLQTVHLLALLPMSLPGLIGRSVGMWLGLVTPGRADGFVFSEMGGERQRKKRFKAPGTAKPAETNACWPNTEMLFSLRVKNWLYTFKRFTLI